MPAEREALRDWHRLFGLPLHLFSASPDLVAYGRSAYRRRSPNTSMVLGQLFDALQGEGLAMYTMEDFRRDCLIKQFAKMTPEEQEQLLQAVPPEKRLAGLSAEQIREYLDRLTAGARSSPRKPRRKK